MSEDTRRREPPRTLWGHVVRGFVEAHRRRPVSFYLLLTVPVVLVLGAQMAAFRDQPKRFALILTVLLLFFLVISIKAVREFFAIMRAHVAESRRVYRETLGDEAFVSELVERARKGRGEG